MKNYLNINIFEDVQTQLMGIDDISELRKFISNEYHLDEIIEPNTIPIKYGYTRLYHQTDKEHFNQIKNDKSIDIYKSTGKMMMEPTCVWGYYNPNNPTNGFYGEVKKRYTIEYQVPILDVETGRVCRSIKPDEIIAFHDPNLYNIKRLIYDDDYLTSIIEMCQIAANDETWANADGESERAYYLIANAILKYKLFK